MEPGAISPREREVLALLGEQLTHAEIGRRLFISVRTVESHVASLRRKLDLRDHRALVRYAAVHVDAASATRARVRPFAPLTSFVGRSAELAELVAAVRDAHVVTAVGPGGVGKTRLAWAAATALGAEFDDVRWVDLVPVTDSGRLDEAVAQACDAPVSSRLGPVEALAAAFGDRAVLLVLDNVEQVLDAAAVLAERLAAACPRLHLLLTSRARLAVPFERVVRVDGLSGDVDGDAVALFVERTIAAGCPAPDDGDRVRIAEVCSVLGGLALAIELAAVRVPSLGLDGVARSLLDRSGLGPDGLLTGGDRVHRRHRSMHETLDWSLALVDEPTVRTLHRLAVLVAPFDAANAEAVAAFPPLTAQDVAAGLSRLAEHHLVAATLGSGPMRYRMLEPVRQYALAQMDDADRLVHAHHLAWCLRSATTLVGNGTDDAARTVADDVRAALARPPTGTGDRTSAAALARAFALLLYRDGDLAEAQERWEQAAALDADGAVAALDLARAAAAAKCRVLGEESLRLELAAAERARDAGDKGCAARALGRAVEVLNRFPGMFAEPPEPGAADRLAGDARALAGDDPLALATLAVATAGYASTAGAAGEAAARAALAAARRVGDGVLESSALDAMSGAALFAGEVVRAHELAQARLAAVSGWRDDPAVGLELKDALHVATFCALGAGDLGAAATAAAAQRDLPFLRHRRDLADEELAAPAALAGDLDATIEAGERFLSDWTAAGRPVAPGRGIAPAAVALAHGLRGDREARATWLGVLAQMRGVGVEDGSRGSGYGELFEALVMLHEGRAGDAVEALAEADGGGLFARVFRQWIAAVRAEAAVIARTPGCDELVETARRIALGNPLASAITTRAAALRVREEGALLPLAEEFERLGARYQAWRTRDLHRRHP